MGAFWQLSPWQFAGLAGSVLCLVLALWVLWAARHRAEHEWIHLPIVGRVSNPLCLTLGLCLLASAYHAAAYSLLPAIVLTAVPRDRWWLLVAVMLVALASARMADKLESRSESD